MTTEPSQALSIHLLGGFRVSVGGEEIPAKRFRLHKARSLVKLLALAPKHQLHREQIMEQLWPDFEPQFAAANLRQTIYIARRSLGARDAQFTSFLTTQDEILCLGEPGDVWVDVEAFENAAAWARRSTDLASIQSALSLYSGDLLPEDCYEDWCAARRESLRQEHLELLLALAALHAESREYPQAIQALQQVLAAEPEREDAHIELMRLYALSGQRTLAVRQYEILQEMLSRELGVEPAAGSRELYQEILSGKYPDSASVPAISPKFSAPAITSTPRHNLPARLSSFIGRAGEIGAVTGALKNNRLVTLTGAGGVGKSSLAVQCALQAVSDFPDGAWLVELAALSDPQLLPQVVAGVFHLRPDHGGDFLPSLQYYLASKQLLLVLDNCEHLIAACASLAQNILERCPGVRILATSREPLEIAGEQVYPLHGLSFPPAEESFLPGEYPIYTAVQLFVERASAALPDFRLSPANAPAVAQVCRRLDGIPLAVELAAARVPLLRVEQIAARLADSFHLLVHGERTALPRHQTLQACIDWSYNLLPEAEQKVLRRLSVFAGGWTLEAAESVCSGEGVRESHILNCLEQLANKSLLIKRTPGEQARFNLLEMTRQYARQKLIESGEERAVRQRHLEYYLQLGEAGKHTPANDWMDRLLLLKPERDNFRAALSWALDETPQVNAELGLRLANAFLSGGKRIDPEAPTPASQYEFLDWSRKGLARIAEMNLPDCPAQAEALCWMGGILYNDQGFQLAMQGVDLYRKLPHTDPRDLAWALGLASQRACIVKGDCSLGRALSEEGLTVLRSVEGQFMCDLAFVLNYNSISAWMNEEYAVAQRDAQQAYLLFMQEADLSYAAVGLRFLALIHEAQGEYSAARSEYQNALQLLQQIPSGYEEYLSTDINVISQYIADLDYRTGNFSVARDGYQTILASARNKGDPKIIGNLCIHLARVELALGNPDKTIDYLQQTITISRIMQSDILWFRTLPVFAEVFMISGQGKIAAVLLGATESRKKGLYGVAKVYFDQRVKAAKSTLGEAAFAEAFVEGQALTLEQAADFALGALKAIENPE